MPSSRLRWLGLALLLAAAPSEARVARWGQDHTGFRRGGRQRRRFARTVKVVHLAHVVHTGFVEDDGRFRDPALVEAVTTRLEDLGYEVVPVGHPTSPRAARFQATPTGPPPQLPEETAYLEIHSRPPQRDPGMRYPGRAGDFPRASATARSLPFLPAPGSPPAPEGTVDLDAWALAFLPGEPEPVYQAFLRTSEEFPRPYRFQARKLLRRWPRSRFAPARPAEADVEGEGEAPVASSPPGPGAPRREDGSLDIEALRARMRSPRRVVEEEDEDCDESSWAGLPIDVRMRRRKLCR